MQIRKTTTNFQNGQKDQPMLDYDCQYSSTRVSAPQPSLILKNDSDIIM